jgi:hypothetical protein
MKQSSYSGVTQSQALDLVEGLQDPEEQAAALVEMSYLIENKRYLALMKRIASPESPNRAVLFGAQKKLDIAKAEKKARAAFNKSKPKLDPLIPPNLFDVFK